MGATDTREYQSPETGYPDKAQEVTELVQEDAQQDASEDDQKQRPLNTNVSEDEQKEQLLDRGVTEDEQKRQPLNTSIIEDDQKERVNTEAMSKSAKKKLLKMQKFEAKKAQRKEIAKQKKREELERKRQDWEDVLTQATEEEKASLIEAKLNARKERMALHLQQREKMKEKLSIALSSGQNIVIDLEFSHLMTPSELNSLSQQIMYCYAANRKSQRSAHLWITGFQGEIKNQLQRIPGFDNWLIDKKEVSYIEAFYERKENLVYLTADSENVLNELEASKTYVIGGLVDRNRWKGITMKKATDQGIQTAKLPIADYLKMTASQVLTVNQVFEILLAFLESRDWKTSLFQVVPPRKRPEEDSRNGIGDSKKQCIVNENLHGETLVTNTSVEKSNLCESSAPQ